MMHSSRPKVSIVVPSYNGGTLLSKVVSAALRQEIWCDYELLIVDSESNDGSIESLPIDHRLSIYRIRKNEFGHGKTRNFAATLAIGDYIAYLTQDAIPAHRYWLAALVQPLADNRDIAGVFGPHIAHRDHNIFTSLQLDRHFNDFIYPTHMNPIAIASHKACDNDPLIRHLSAAERFYSDNNSCLRASVLEEIPYPDVAYGEDQLWAAAILEAGLKKAYAPLAYVRHSHEYSFRMHVARSMTDWHFHSQYLCVKLPHLKKEVLQMAAESVREDLSYMQTHAITPSEKDVALLRKMHFARACGFYLAGRGKGSIVP